MQLTVQALSAMNTASTPEEAYKIFAATVSKGLGDLVAKALGDALGTTIAAMGTANPAIAGWEQYVQGIGMSMTWGTPGFKMPPTILTSFSSAPVGGTPTPSVLGGSITIGGTWSF